MATFVTSSGVRHGTDGNDLITTQKEREALDGGNGNDTLENGSIFNALFWGGRGDDLFRVVDPGGSLERAFNIRIWEHDKFQHTAGIGTSAGGVDTLDLSALDDDTTRFTIGGSDGYRNWTIYYADEDGNVIGRITLDGQMRSDVESGVDYMKIGDATFDLHGFASVVEANSVIKYGVTSGDDTFTTSIIPYEVVNSYSGDDSITIEGSDFGYIYGGNGDDTITVSPDLVDWKGEIRGDDGDDRLLVSGGTVKGGNGSDTFVVMAPSSLDQPTSLKIIDENSNLAERDVLDLSLLTSDLGQLEFGQSVGSDLTIIVRGSSNDTVATITLHAQFDEVGKGVEAIILGDQVIEIGGALDLVQLEAAVSGEVSNEPDSIVGSDTADTIYGMGGADTIESGLGADLVYGGIDDDRIDASSGNDTVYAGLNDDFVLGGLGDDRLHGDKGDDTLDGGPGDDQLSGDDGDDKLLASQGSDTLSGGNGNDTLVADGSFTRLNGGGGDDVFAFAEAFVGNVEIVEGDIWSGNTLDLTNFVSSLDNLEYVRVGSSKTLLYALDESGQRVSQIDVGYLGFQRYWDHRIAQYIRHGDTVWEVPDDLESIEDFYAFLGITSRLVHRIEGTQGPDTLVASANDTIHGLGGDDLISTDAAIAILRGQGGDDTLVAAHDMVQMRGGEGDDVYVINWQGDAQGSYFRTTISPFEDQNDNPGLDTLDLTPLDWDISHFSFYPANGDLVVDVRDDDGNLFGRIHLEQVHYNGQGGLSFVKIGSTVYDISSVSNQHPFHSSELVNGAIKYQQTSGNDTIVGLGYDAVLGMHGNDNITSGGYDTLYGGSGDDTLRSGGQGRSVLYGDQGSDTFVITPWQTAGYEHDGNQIQIKRSGAESGETDTLDLSAFSADQYELRFSSGAGGFIVDIKPIDSGFSGQLLVSNPIDVLRFDDMSWDVSEFEHYGHFNQLFYQGVSDYDAAPLVDVIGPSGDSLIDALLAGTRYVAEGDEDPRVVTYSIPGFESWFVDGYGIGEPDGWGGSPPSVGLVANAMNLVSLYTNLVLQRVDDIGDVAGTIRVSFSDQLNDEALAWAYLPEATAEAGDIWLNDYYLDRYDQDLPFILLHELGHALGLKHPFETIGDSFPALSEQYEGNDYTVMSYTVSARHPDAVWASSLPQTYMALDIRALQYLYGTNLSANSGNDTYEFHARETNYLTLWDSGGTDTISILEGSGQNSISIDLTPGTWSALGAPIRYVLQNDDEIFENETVFIMDDTIIENVISGAGDDQVYGNGANNKIRGNGGDDTLDGRSGSDTLVGGKGDDLAFGGDGNDAIWAGAGDAGADSYYGGAGHDIIGVGAGDDLGIGGAGNDILFGAGGDDTLIGGFWIDEQAVSANGGANQVWGGGGNDVIYGGEGADSIGGGLGHDDISGYEGNDIIYSGRSGDDTLAGGAGNDVIFGGTGDDLVDGGLGSDEIYGGTGADVVIGDSGTDSLYGGAGDDRLQGGKGDDILRGGAGSDTFIFLPGDGKDEIKGFTPGEDILDLSASTTNFTDITSLQSAVTDTSAGLQIDLGGGDSILLTNVIFADLTADSFIF